MKREQAILKLAEFLIKEYSDKERKEILECWFPNEYEVGNEEIAKFPAELQRELCNGTELGDPMNNKYDPIIFEEIIRGCIGVRNEYILDKLKSFNIEVEEIEGEPEKLFACPCCGYKTLDAPGEYDICAVCFWEDDGSTKDEDYSGPNHITLGEGKTNFLKFGACDERAKAHVDNDGPNKYEK